MHLSRKTLHHLHMQYKGSSARIFLYLLFWDVFNKKNFLLFLDDCNPLTLFVKVTCVVDIRLFFYGLILL